MIKGYIFDMDGTLIDSMPMWFNINREFLNSMNIELTEELARALGPLTVTETVDYLLKRFGFPMTKEELLNMFFEIVRQKYITDVSVKPGVFDFLKYSKEHHMRMCIATATEAELALEVVERLGLMDYMEFLISCKDVGESKNHPTVYLEAAKKLQLAPQEIDVFEDVYYCAETAKNAGFNVVGVRDSMVSDKEALMLKNLCDRYIISF
jgi:haloacid dehalogenase superfamily, subfamily IA, variant 3 with third motif having DD or ED